MVHDGEVTAVDVHNPCGEPRMVVEDHTGSAVTADTDGVSRAEGDHEGAPPGWVVWAWELGSTGARFRACV